MQKKRGQGTGHISLFISIEWTGCVKDTQREQQKGREPHATLLSFPSFVIAVVDCEGRAERRKGKVYDAKETSMERALPGGRSRAERTRDMQVIEYHSQGYSLECSNVA